MYKRLLKEIIGKKFFKGKAIILTGARQTGKTTLSLELINTAHLSKTAKIFNCDNPTDRELLHEKDIDFLKGLIGESKIIFIDEGQKVAAIGQTIKLFVDFYKADKQVIVTGSSSINLLDSTQETLTGRKYIYTLFPMSLEEIFPDKNHLKIAKELKELLIFGGYPEVAAQGSFKDKIELLQELSSSYLYKDILEFQQVKNSSVIMGLLKALALQIGSEVSFTELSNLIGIDKKTIERYIDLLEKNFVIFRLAPYAKNKRREMSKLRKIYFYDTGIRNAIINNFNFADSRNDMGALWENFLVSERLKYRAYHGIHADQYFWRTYDGSEVDLIEEREGKLYGYEFKWGGNIRKTRKPSKWLEYKNSSCEFITVNRLEGFII